MTAYIRRHASALEDNATLDGLDAAGYANGKGDPVWLDQTVLTQELRLASSDRTARLSWVVGASYGHAHYDESQDIATSALADGGAFLYYATVAKGYRMGGPNDTVGVACPVSTPLSYRPNLVWSYEIGAKNSLFDARLQVDSRVFYIAWRDMQLPIPLTNCGLGFTVIAGTVTSDGFDLGVQVALTGHLKVALTAAYTDAHYAETVTLNNLVVVSRGDAIGALPLVTAPWSVTT